MVIWVCGYCDFDSFLIIIIDEACCAKGFDGAVVVHRLIFGSVCDGRYEHNCGVCSFIGVVLPAKRPGVFVDKPL